MSLFDLLVVAHFVGDWMFQTNWMADNKRGRPRSRACVLHCLVYSAVVAGGIGLAALGGMVDTSPWRAFGAVGFVLFTHWLIDGFNLPQRWSDLVNHTPKQFVLIVVDQTMHLATLALLAWWLVSA